MIHTIKNNKIQLSVKQTGAEICSLKSLESGTEYIWQANPDVWANHAPILFPIVGALKDKTFKYKGKEYSLPQHGFMRYNKKVELISQTTDSLSFSLKSSKESLKVYPFEFEFITTFTLKDSSVQIMHKVLNTADAEMYFSLGEHPAFKCPLHDDETYSDYYLEFEQNETAKSWQLAGSLIGNKSIEVFKDNNIIALHPDIFNEGALVFKDLKSKKISIKSKKSKQVLTVSFDGFPFMGIWAKAQAEFVCIEPWLGIADSVNTNQQFTDKDGIIKLDGKESYQASYFIEIVE